MFFAHWLNLKAIFFFLITDKSEHLHCTEMEVREVFVFSGGADLAQSLFIIM